MRDVLDCNLHALLYIEVCLMRIMEGDWALNPCATFTSHMSQVMMEPPCVQGVGGRVDIPQSASQIGDTPCRCRLDSLNPLKLWVRRWTGHPAIGGGEGVRVETLPVSLRWQAREHTSHHVWETCVCFLLLPLIAPVRESDINSDKPKAAVEGLAQGDEKGELEQVFV